MARFRRALALPAGTIVPRERQLSLLERLETLRQRAECADPLQPALRLFFVVLVLLGLGLALQASHAATTQPAEQFWSGLWAQGALRVAALVALLVGLRLGPERLRPLLPALVALCVAALVLVYVPGVSSELNGSRRWLKLPGTGLTFQPSELARIVLVLWLADRCVRLGPAVQEWKRGVWPMLRVAIPVFLLILCQTDLGGALLFLLCFAVTMWVGGARLAHLSAPIACAGGAAVLALMMGASYVRHRIATFLGDATNDQVLRSAEAMASGDWFGVGLGQGLFRNAGVPYLESDYVFALVGEELGLFGTLSVVGLYLCFLWHGLQLVLAVRDRYLSLAAFGLLLCVGLQAMVHLQVVAGLAPPKGMTLPFVSHGGTSLIVSCLAVGLALGAARPRASIPVVPEPAPAA
jgi:cell division protein FtsW